MREDRKQVTFTPQQLALARAIAGEVTFGIRDSRLSVDVREHLEQAHDIFDRIEQSQSALETNAASSVKAELELSQADLDLLCRMADDTLRCLGEEEFEIRTGFDFREGKAFRELCRQKLVAAFGTNSH